MVRARQLLLAAAATGLVAPMLAVAGPASAKGPGSCDLTYPKPSKSLVARVGVTGCTSNGVSWSAWIRQDRTLASDKTVAKVSGEPGINLKTLNGSCKTAGKGRYYTEIYYNGTLRQSERVSRC